MHFFRYWHFPLKKVWFSQFIQKLEEKILPIPDHTSEGLWRTRIPKSKTFIISFHTDDFFSYLYFFSFRKKTKSFVKKRKVLKKNEKFRKSPKSFERKQKFSKKNEKFRKKTKSFEKKRKSPKTFERKRKKTKSITFRELLLYVKIFQS